MTQGSSEQKLLVDSEVISTSNLGVLKFEDGPWKKLLPIPIEVRLGRLTNDKGIIPRQLISPHAQFLETSMPWKIWQCACKMISLNAEMS